MMIHSSKPSYWMKHPGSRAYSPLQEDVRTDIAIVGGGITGATTAYLLAKAGAKVLLVDGGNPGSGETGHGSAHLSHVYDTRLRTLRRKYGLSRAKLVWDSLAIGLDLISSTVSDESIDCDFRHVTGYLYGEDDYDRRELTEERSLAEAIGYPSEAVDPARLPVPCSYALSFSNQATFHPLKYLDGLLRCAKRHGCRIHSRSVVRDLDLKHLRLTLENGVRISADRVILAGHVPFTEKLFLHMKQAAYRSYLVAFKVPEDRFEDALYWDNQMPSHYTCLMHSQDGIYLLIGGEDHKTGQDTDTLRHFKALQSYGENVWRVRGEPQFRWSGQVIEPNDGVPFIGRSPASDRVLVASGLSGDGLTYGSFAGFVLSEQALDNDTPFDRLYAPDRLVLKGTKEFFLENVDYATYFVKDWFRRRGATSFSDISPGEGMIMHLKGRQVGVYRDDSGRLHGVSTICPHLGCHVHWNSAEQSWDCPCHGSRFTAQGQVCNGPAQKDLKSIDLSEYQTG